MYLLYQRHGTYPVIPLREHFEAHVWVVNWVDSLKTFHAFHKLK